MIMCSAKMRAVDWLFIKTRPNPALCLGSTMPNDKMSREEAERWLAELTADPGRMSAKVFQEGYEASLRKSGLPEAKIFPLLRKARQIYDELVEDEDDVVEGETEMMWIGKRLKF